ncbi:MAG TPA: glutamate--tRNA ligase family protein [Streptosporangiaceae bacterium]|nr:glutamate--tRNA ligase family protein [Streptosporangiaceae bacterium]
MIDALFPADLPEPDHWEQRYPPRDLPVDALVTRLGPSPTGFMHIGTIYMAMIDLDVAHRSAGRYLVRIEDTDQAREVQGALEQFGRAFSYFGLPPDEEEGHGDYGPYHQSERSAIYMSYARELLRQGKAYLCFATAEDLAEMRKQQQAAKVPPGYYGRWALWRDATPEQVQAKLDEGVPYVVRFRSPGTPGRRVEFDETIRGRMSAEDNYNDVVILKSSQHAERLPTYHFAHAVDDHLMRVNLVIRGEEWLPSVPMHLQLFHALGFEPPQYAHTALLMKQIPGGKRKLSKRKDPEASVDFYTEAGYPAKAVLYYLRGLANGSLAEIPLDAALEAPIRLSELGGAGPLIDQVKLEDISADYIATLSPEEILTAMRIWASQYDKELAAVLDAEQELALAALAVERVGVDNPRKDLRKWSDFRSAYGFFFSELFTLVNLGDERLGALPDELVRAFAADFADGYQDLAERDEWFAQVRDLAAKHGFAPSAKAYKQTPDEFVGSIRNASQVIRVALTGSTRSPDLAAVARVLGKDEVLRRVSSLTQ